MLSIYRPTAGLRGRPAVEVFGVHVRAVGREKLRSHWRLLSRPTRSLARRRRDRTIPLPLPRPLPLPLPNNAIPRQPTPDACRVRGACRLLRAATACAGAPTAAERASRVRRIEAPPPLSREPRQRRTPATSSAKRATGRTRHASVCPFSAERISAVDATSFWMLMSAPNAISASSAPSLPARPRRVARRLWQRPMTALEGEERETVPASAASIAAVVPCNGASSASTRTARRRPRPSRDPPLRRRREHAAHARHTDARSALSLNPSTDSTTHAQATRLDCAAQAVDGTLRRRARLHAGVSHRCRRRCRGSGGGP